jgi:hypothetical protein
MKLGVVSVVSTSRSAGYVGRAGVGPKPVRTSRQGRRQICRELPSACVAPSMSLSLPSLSWSTCVIVRTASAGRACHGAAPRTFLQKPSAWRAPTRSTQGRVRPALVSTTVSVQPVGSRFAGPARRVARDLESRLGHSTIRHSPPHRCLFGKNDDTNGRLPWKMWRIGTRNRLLAEAINLCDRTPPSNEPQDQCRRAI